MADLIDGEAQYLCSLYQTQVRFRSGVNVDSPDTEIIAPPADPMWSPIVLATWSETRLLCAPSVASAVDLLTAYDRQDMVLNVFTSHWTYKAGMSLLTQENCSDTNLAGHVLAIKVLERCASKWPNARALQNTLQDYAMSKAGQG